MPCSKTEPTCRFVLLDTVEVKREKGRWSVILLDRPKKCSYWVICSIHIFSLLLMISRRNTVIAVMPTHVTPPMVNL